jgi:hypothetical protein
MFLFVTFSVWISKLAEGASACSAVGVPHSVGTPELPCNKKRPVTSQSLARSPIIRSGRAAVRRSEAGFRAGKPFNATP